MDKKYNKIFKEIHLQNSVKIDALIRLFIDKGMIDENEYLKMQNEVQEMMMCCVVGNEKIEELGLSPESEI